MSMDQLGNLYVADYVGRRVQMISIISESACSGEWSC